MRLLVTLISMAAVCSQSSMPLPFTRVLQPSTPAMNGTDVLILQNLILRAVNGVQATGVYDGQTAFAVKTFQSAKGLQPNGVFDADTASLVLSQLSSDGYKDDGQPPSAQGFLYKVFLPVYRNRSVETTASLIAPNGTAVYHFIARAHGADSLPPAAWPAFNNSGAGLNMFTDDGATPTGLILFDLNSPEDDPVEFGPYPVNRAVQGIAGNAKFLIPNIRDGILLHTGAWQNYSSWTPGLPMPNSLGCIHAYPDTIKTIWQILTNDFGVVVNPNTDGALPYPYKPQGLLSIQQMD